MKWERERLMYIESLILHASF